MRRKVREGPKWKGEFRTYFEYHLASDAAFAARWEAGLLWIFFAGMNEMRVKTKVCEHQIIAIDLFN